MEKKGSYVGSIKNSGTQMVKAPINATEQKKGTVRHTGSDLRQGTKGGK